jgi:TRAP-type transport system small permease protein
MASRIKWFLVHFEEVMCAVMFAAMSVITFANVITRYWFRYSFAFLEELVVALFVWITLFGTAAAFRHRAHLNFSFVTERLPLFLQKILHWLSISLSVTLFAYLIYFFILQIRDEMLLNITSSGIGVPQWWYTIGVPIASVLVIFRIIQGASEKHTRGES